MTDAPTPTPADNPGDPPAPGWPTPLDLARRLGLQATDDAQGVAEAMDAAIADAIYHGIDATVPALDGGQWLAVVDLGVAWYQNRNRRESYADAGPYAVNAPTRSRLIQIITRGKVAIA